MKIDALRTTLLFIYNAYKNVELTGESALGVLYIGIRLIIISKLATEKNLNRVEKILSYILSHRISIALHG